MKRALLYVYGFSLFLAINPFDYKYFKIVPVYCSSYESRVLVWFIGFFPTSAESEHL